MGLLRQHQNNGQIPYYTGLQIQTSGNNVPISIVWGANKIAPNCIWTGGFYGYYGYPEYSHGGGGGKGGGGGNNNAPAQSWQYYTSWEMGLCEGPIAGFGTIWQGGNPTNFYGADIWGVYTGTQTQGPWGELTVSFPSQALSYHGLAYITSFNYYLGSTANLPQFSLEIFGVLFNSAGINGGDADPAQIIQDFLTNSQYGVGFPSGSIDAATLFSPGSGPDSSYQGYCRAAYLALSPALTNQETANSILARWLRLTNTSAVWSGGQLKFIPYGDSVVGPTPNQYFGSVTFTPNVTPIYNLTDDDFVHEDGKDPVEVTRTDPYACHNWQRLQINERISGWLPETIPEPWVIWSESNSYVPVPIDVWDQNAIELYGLRMAPDITANEICDPSVGQNSAQLILQRGLYIRNHYKFKLSFEYCLLEPMDLVTITDTLLGLNNVAVRIIEIEEDDSGMLAVTAEEFPGDTATAVQYPVQGGGGNSISQNVVPARVNAPVIFEPPSSLTGGVAKVFIAASGGVAAAYTLAETSATGTHYTQQAYAAALTYSASYVTTLTFSIYVQVPLTSARTAARLNINAGSTTVTMSAGSPGVVTWPGNNLVSGQPVIFSTTGALLSPLTAGTIYYALPVTAGITFNIAATPGGAAIALSGTQSGTQTVNTTLGADFNLGANPSFSADAGVTASIASAATGSSWYLLTISTSLAANSTPIVYVYLENPFKTTSYAGTLGDGVYIWGQQFGWSRSDGSASEPATFLPAFSTVVNASVATNGVSTPEGVAGVADPNWGGANVYLSTDGNTYQIVGQVLGASRQGILTANLAAFSGTNPDTADTLSVSLVESGGTLTSGTAIDAANGVTLCLVEKELLSFETATLTGTNAYNLTTLYRGLDGTAAASHSSGAPFVRVDSTVFQYPLPASFIGVTIYVKLQSFNSFGLAVEDLSECQVWTYTPTGAGSPVGPVTATLLLGQNLDFGAVSAAVTETDQWGIVTDGIMLARIDLGAGI
ncbi:MAG: phage tail protein [Methylocella sp.]